MVTLALNIAAFLFLAFIAVIVIGLIGAFLAAALSNPAVLAGVTLAAIGAIVGLFFDSHTSDGSLAGAFSILFPLAGGAIFVIIGLGMAIENFTMRMYRGEATISDKVGLALTVIAPPAIYALHLYSMSH